MGATEMLQQVMCIFTTSTKEGKYTCTIFNHSSLCTISTFAQTYFQMSRKHWQ